MGSNEVPFTREVWIDRSDFKAVSDGDFFRLCPGATVGLLSVPGPMTYVSHTTGADGQPHEIVCRYDADPRTAPKPKAWIQWVATHAASRSPVHVKDTRIFTRLFKSDDPASLGSDYVADIDPESLVRLPSAMLETGIWRVIDNSLERARVDVKQRQDEAAKLGVEAPPSVDGLEVIRFQGMRVAYFALDVDSRLAGLEKQEGKVQQEGTELVLNQIAPLKQDAKKA